MLFYKIFTKQLLLRSIVLGLDLPWQRNCAETKEGVNMIGDIVKVTVDRPMGICFILRLRIQLHLY